MEHQPKRIIHTITRFKYIIYVFFCATGILLCYLGNQNENQICLGIGCSLIASCVISFVLLFCFSDLEDRYDLQEKWGLEYIYPERTVEIRKDTIPRHNLDFIAFGLSRFIEANSDIEDIKDRLLKGLCIRIITMHPDSIFVDKQGLFENQKTDISCDIRCLVKWVENIKENLPADCKYRIDIKFYGNLPLIFYCRADSRIFTGPYLPNRPSGKDITYEYSTSKEGGQYYIRFFDKIWNQEENPIFFIPENEVFLKSDVRKSITVILSYFSNLVRGDNGSVVGIVVVFKDNYRRTFFSCKNSTEKHLCYEKDEGAFGDFLAHNDWVTQDRFKMIFKDYRHKELIIQEIYDRTPEPIIKRHLFCADAKKMGSRIDAVLIAPLIRNDEMIGAVTFDFVNFCSEYEQESWHSRAKPCDSEAVPLLEDVTVTNWFEHARNCANMINELIGNQVGTDFNNLFHEEWTKDPS